MDASVHVLRRRLLLARAQPGRCACRAPQTLASRSQFLRKPTHLISTNIRSFSSSSKRWLEQVSEPDRKVSNGLTHPSSPAQTTPKQALKTFVSSVQKIIDGYQLGKKGNLHERLHSNLIVALSNAEARLNAPDATPESFGPLLKSLQGEVTPVLKSRFGSSDVSKIIADIGQQPTEQPQQPRPQSQPQPQRSGGIGQLLDDAYASSWKSSSKSDTGGRTDAQKFQTISSTLLGDEPRRGAGHNIRSAFTAPGTVAGALSSIDRAYDGFQASKAKGPNLRLTSSLGKSVEVTGAIDLTRAFQRMEMICARNAVKRDVARQRFHVRRGQLKKNLRMERWRRLFKEGFIAECSRVRRMRRQGW